MASGVAKLLKQTLTLFFSFAHLRFVGESGWNFAEKLCFSGLFSPCYCFPLEIVSMFNFFRAPRKVKLLHAADRQALECNS